MFETIIATLALAVSAVTAWLSLFRRGVVRMTHPTMVVFAQDSEERTQKIVVRALLYCTADRGRVIENMYAVLRREKESIVFAFWGYGDKTAIERGGGLYVDREGVAVNHHFVLLSKTDPCKYEAAAYAVEFFATMVGENKPHKLAESRIALTPEMVAMLNSKAGGVMFNWNPTTADYTPESKPIKIDLSEIMGPGARRT